jgi:FkbM family methyltransferase
MSKTIELPNHLKLEVLSETEAKVLYHEIFVMKAYSQSPIQLHDGDCVFDVGANIGLYSMFLSRSFRNIKIFAFEPIPEIFSILKANTQRADSSTIECLNLGLSNQPRTAQFQFERGFSIMTSMYPDQIRQCVRADASIDDWAIATLHDLKTISQIPTWLSSYLKWLLNISILRYLGLGSLGAILWWLRRDLPSSPQLIDCQLTTVSEIIHQYQIESISLMKIDVEGSELDILLGIKEQDWSKIKQFTIEVHDIDRRVETITKMLTGNGYQVYINQEDWDIHQLMNLYKISAVRN